MKLSQASLQLILDFEVGGGRAYYDKFLLHPEWPGGESGVTVGIGFDCRFSTRDEILNIWFDHPDKNTLAGCAGLHHEAAKARARELSRLATPYDLALEVFNRFTIPHYSVLAEKIYPGLDQLKPDAYGAIVSLVYNRGTSLNGESRREMAALVPLVAAKDYQGIASRIRAMQRLWPNVRGLQQRREAEARLVYQISL